MFYSQDILQKRGGRFAKIWLAATKMSKLSRREVASINVKKSCDEILSYIELRVAPAYQGGRRPRFSLYLSSLLMYGVVRIHHKNCEYLLNDATMTLIRVRSVSTLIDLQETPKADQVTNPEILLEEVQQEQDLYLSQLDTEALRTGHLETGDFWGFSGSHSIAASPRKKRKWGQDEPVVQVASADKITLQEPPPLIVDTPLSPIQVPKDVELPMLDGREMDLLMGAQFEEPPLQVSDLLPTSTPFSFETDGAERQRLRSQQTLASESPCRIRQEEKEKTPERAPAVEVPESRAVPQSPGITQQIITSPLPRRQVQRKSLELELTSVLPGRTQRRRKRQLAFADAETQIPKAKMKQNMATRSDTCQKFILPDVKGVGALDLLAVPGRIELRKQPWLSQWTQNARFRRNIPEGELAEAISPPRSPALQEELPAQEIPRMQENEETVRPVQPPLSPVIPPQPDDHSKSRRNISTLEESVEELRRISVSMMGTPAPEISSVEFQRDASTSRIEEPRMLGLDESLVLDDSRQSKKDRTSTRKRKTRSSVSTDEEQQAPPPAHDTFLSASSLQTSHTSTGRTLYDVVEEPRFEDQYVAMPPLQAVSEEKEHMQEELLRSITDDIEQLSGRYTTFRKVCPPQLLDRKSAARKFTVLLELCAQGSVIVKQKRSYEDIFIRLSE